MYNKLLVIVWVTKHRANDSRSFAGIYSSYKEQLLRELLSVVTTFAAQAGNLINANISQEGTK